MLVDLQQKLKGWVAWLIISGIAVVFIFWGISNYFVKSAYDIVVASVNGEEIKYVEYSKAYQRLLFEREQFIQQNKMNISINEKEIKQQAVNQLILQKLLLQNAHNKKYAVSDSQLDQLLLSYTEFQDDNKFSSERFAYVANQLNLSPAALRDQIGNEFLLKQFVKSLEESSFILPTELDRIIKIAEEKRDIEYIKIPADKFTKSSSITSDAIEQYYNDHGNEYIKSEQVALDYIKISMDDAQKHVTVTDDDIALYYDEHNDIYIAPAGWEVAHILLKQDEKEKITELKQALAQGEDFAKLAKKYSIDTSSAQSGGELGWKLLDELPVTVQSFLSKNTKINIISDPIETEYGIQIVKVLDYRPEHVKEIAEVQDSIRATLKQQKAYDMFVEMKENISILAAEYSDSLSAVKDEYNLEPSKTALFTKDQMVIEGIIATPQIRDIAFSPELVMQHENSEVLDLTEGEAIIFRVREHLASHKLALISVRDEINKELLLQQSVEKVQKLGKEALKQLQSGDSLASIAKNNALQVEKVDGITRFDYSMTQDLLKLFFNNSLQPKDLPKTYGYHQSGTQDYYIINITKVQVPNEQEVEAAKSNYSNSIKSLLVNLEYGTYENELKKHSDIVTYDLDVY